MEIVLEISIAVCLEEFMVDKILCFDVFKRGHPDETILKLALIASACSDNLRREYRSMEDTPTQRRIEEETWHLPNPTAATPSPNTLIPVLELKARLGRGNRKINYAPKLHACELVIGGQKMVVMDRLDGTRMFDAEDQSSAQGLR